MKRVCYQEAVAAFVVFDITEIAGLDRVTWWKKKNSISSLLVPQINDIPKQEAWDWLVLDLKTFSTMFFIFHEMTYRGLRTL
jgi:hypothetical protein